jgi:hypothetical protein
MMLRGVQNKEDDYSVALNPVKDLVRKTRSEQPVKSPVILRRPFSVFVKALD